MWTAKETIYKKGRKEEKTTYGMGEDTCKWCNPRGSNFQNIQTTHTTQLQKNKQPNRKIGSKPK